MGKYPAKDTGDNDTDKWTDALEIFFENGVDDKDETDGSEF